MFKNFGGSITNIWYLSCVINDGRSYIHCKASFSECSLRLMLIWKTLMQIQTLYLNIPELLFGFIILSYYLDRRLSQVLLHSVFTVYHWIKYRWVLLNASCLVFSCFSFGTTASCMLNLLKMINDINFSKGKTKRYSLYVNNIGCVDSFFMKQSIVSYEEYEQSSFLIEVHIYPALIIMWVAARW